jgi:hypothetical protein
VRDVGNALRRCLGAFVLAAMLAPLITACSNAAKTSLVVGLDESIGALAAGGVAVMDDVTARTPLVGLSGVPSAMRFTRWQLRNLVAEGNAHGGYLGSDLDALVTPPPGSPGLSVIVGAWLKRDEGTLAPYARRFMGDQDYKQPKTILFPTIVVLAFVADIARVPASVPASPTAFDLGPWIAAPAEAAGSCSDVADWVSTVVNNVTTAVQANGSGWLASLWNVVVSIAGTAFTLVVNGVLQSIVGFVTEVATVVGTLMQVASMFKPWTVQLAADPALQVLGPSPGSGAFDATLSAQDIAWPQSLVGCVSTLTSGHVDLTEASYKNARITWSQPVGIPTLASNDAKDATLRADKTAHYTYSTVTRQPIPADDCPTLVPAGNIGITITVERKDVSKVIDSLVQLIANKLPAKLQAFLQPYEQPAIDAAKAAVGNFKGPRASAAASVMEYVADPLCQHTPPPSTPTPQAGQTGRLPLVPCTALVLGAIGSAYPGAVIENTIPHNPELRAFLNNQAQWILLRAKKTGVETHGQENNPRIAGTSSCAIGPSYDPGPEPSEEKFPPVEAFFITVPADGTPVETAQSNPTCVTAMGPELDYFQAECWIMTSSDHAGGPVNGTLIFVFTNDAEYVVEVLQGSSGAGLTLMRNVLQDLEHGPPPTAPAQATPIPPPPTPVPPAKP